MTVKCKTTGYTNPKLRDSEYCLKCWNKLYGKTESNEKSPNHYGQGQIECIEYIRDTLTDEELIGYYRGNIIKYSHRWRYKDGVKDLKKAQEYLGWLIDFMERTD